MIRTGRTLCVPAFLRRAPLQRLKSPCERLLSGLRRGGAVVVRAFLSSLAPLAQVRMIGSVTNTPRGEPETARLFYLLVSCRACSLEYKRLNM